ncbi:hypothetical protein SRABI106_03357 [Rahnella aquatilis]|nr:hypothetical protein SRABI106_03357 [Rahnella aquatilis]
MQTKDFYTQLIELTIATFLRAFVTEHRTDVPQTLFLIVQQTMFNTGAHAARRTFRTQRQAFAVAVFKGIHFFFHDISHFTDSAFKQWGLLYNRHTDFTVAVTAKHLFQRSFNTLPQGCVFWQVVVHAANGLDILCHVSSLSFYKK